jgi:hypothetical protein
MRTGPAVREISDAKHTTASYKEFVRKLACETISLESRGGRCRRGEFFVMLDVELPLVHRWKLKHRRRTRKSFHRPAAGILAVPGAGYLVGAPRLFHFLKQSDSSANRRQMMGFKNSTDGAHRCAFLPSAL